ncbi:peptidyl-prolyl cis-trans isomerase [Robiginitalea sp. SC105]|uniref:peptidyl-prolyl cis-trans isomerase n=1 Tax=Robiginitalea sp. SC105 TaxID=2762332 RepID=UPI00163A12B6|nr:peptidyl-prolyl cis-trans isomerase [Robiginitalea sp. SC105]MBC2840026.1 peptidyl-prolyl cis-trans isomerase [Robiginitalea sp. SC105]
MRTQIFATPTFRMLILSMALLALFPGCDSLFRKETEKTPLARVGEEYLYREDITGLVDSDLSPSDSTSFVNNLINSWATKQLLLQKARINLPPAQIEQFESLVSDYRADLYTRAYKEALVAQEADTLIGSSELREFYESEKENFRLQEKIVQLRFLELPRQFINRDEVTQRLRRFDAADQRFLDSVGVQFRKLNFNDSIWVPASRVIEEIPPLTFENQDQYLKKSQFFELEDDAGVYLAEVRDVMEVNDIAPLSYIEPTIRQVLLNRRKLGYLQRLENELIDEAIQQKELQIYEVRK